LLNVDENVATRCQMKARRRKQKEKGKANECQSKVNLFFSPSFVLFDVDKKGELSTSFYNWFESMMKAIKKENTQEIEINKMYNYSS